MASSIATVRISKNAIVSLRVFINRKKLLRNNSREGQTFQAPLLSNNSIICLKSPLVRILISNQDMERLTNEIRDTIILIVYDLSSPEVMETVLGKLRIGSSADFETEILPKLMDENTLSKDLVNVPLQTVTRVAKFKYKLRFKGNWELDIFINNMKKLIKIRHFLLFTDGHMSAARTLELPPNRRILLTEQKTSLESEGSPMIPLEVDGDEMIETTQDAVEDVKPDIKLKYNPIINLGECLSIHILQRPRRHKV
ncbi:hypothetical protein NCAS_0F01720 [Naumovozyma castellii]|uniref:Uncharacterized protein n=1 Tax=Naumovozyma castellii TaxID=27288 RepID=G0VGN5_NAUCA|nr:hypothetical protein NCAS_0F01720 [Naumovozyma castellii CBS 4309]CCC70656.1 hypothetical protein NCAS_0F01720 [Naumovozyma castellii CBS 4309]